ncbi:hypothetical protein NAF17_16875 [Mucilaginibacter sp. RB4R14]|uniref:hypothetical protein n=1 Tax=Mucilaginibacter aurantiaciroseus TaxID=2949308 RepID=UPI002090DE56|nr:hypothetical protein [Mucilaginibacter aurantiaciroseus]MCO5937222.1 hypothetical protein [Mucilaginibacter aurantiaciroseus]
MPDKKLTDNNFELNLLFKGAKDPAEAFSELRDVFLSLSSLDNLFISSIDDALETSYFLESIESGSIKTHIAQIIREIPDEAIKELDWKRIVGHFLLKLKYKVLNYLQNNQSLDSKDALQELAKTLEKEKATLLKTTRIISEVNIYQLLSALEPIMLFLSQLKDNEDLEFKSIDGSVLLNNKVSFNKAKILWELGDKKLESERSEILKVKKLDLLSNSSNWTFKMGNKQIDAKITDQDWLKKYHARDYTLLPEDSLKVNLKVSYIYKSDGKIVKPTYEITKVLDIIYPKNDQESLNI